jgi:hypothetical protein
VLRPIRYVDLPECGEILGLVDFKTICAPAALREQKNDLFQDAGENQILEHHEPDFRKST